MRLRREKIILAFAFVITKKCVNRQKIVVSD